MATSRDYYEILGVEKTASADEIKSAFRKKAKSCHPDINKTPEAEAQFKELGEAYSVLSDENKRRQYDQMGKSAFEQSQNFGGGAGGFGGGFEGFDFNDIDLGDIFGSFFGGGFGGNRKSSHRPVRGSDSLIKMDLTFDEAVFGCKKTLYLDLESECEDCDGLGGSDPETCPECNGRGKVLTTQRTILGTFQSESICPKCGGKGKVFANTCKTCRGKGRLEKEKEIVVTVPEGVDNEDKIRLSGKGEAGYNGGENGDLYIEFHVKPHKLFTRDGDDIYLEVPITITDAVLGTKIEIPTIEDNVFLTINSGTQNGDKYKLRGKGVKRGDMYVIIKILIPEKLSRDQKKLFEELSNTDLDNQKEIKEFNKNI